MSKPPQKENHPIAHRDRMSLITDLPPLDQSLALEESEAPRKSRLSILVIAIIVAIFIGWSTITPVDEVAVGEGEIIPNGFVKSVQHLEGGIVRELKVQEGDFVEKDQVLVTLHPDQSIADLHQLKARYMATKVKIERLRATGMGNKPQFDAFQEADLKDIVNDQKNIYVIKVRDFKNQIEVIERQIEQQKARLAVQLGQRKDLGDRVKVLSDQREVVKGLFEKKLQTKTNLYLIEDRLGEIRQEYNQINNELTQTQEAIAEAEGRRAAITSRFRNDALDEMGKVNAEMFELQEMMRKFKDRVERLEVKSPSRGIVKGMKIHNMRGVVPPGAEIMQVVPVENMEIEAKIMPKDIGNVRPGQSVTIKVSAYDYARYGVIHGTVKSVSASSFIDEARKEPYFKVYVSMDKFYVGSNPRMNRVSPGMISMVEIRTGYKRLSDYIIKPIYNVYTQSFREK